MVGPYPCPCSGRREGGVGWWWLRRWYHCWWPRTEYMCSVEDNQTRLNNVLFVHAQSPKNTHLYVILAYNYKFLLKGLSMRIKGDFLHILMIFFFTTSNFAYFCYFNLVIYRFCCNFEYDIVCFVLFFTHIDNDFINDLICLLFEYWKQYSKIFRNNLWRKGFVFEVADVQVVSQLFDIVFVVSLLVYVSHCIQSIMFCHIAMWFIGS